MSDTANLLMKADGELTLGVNLGLSPYVLIEATLNGEDDVELNVTSGGGVPQDAHEVVEWLRDIAAMIAEALPSNEEGE